MEAGCREEMVPLTSRSFVSITYNHRDNEITVYVYVILNNKYRLNCVVVLIVRDLTEMVLVESKLTNVCPISSIPMTSLV